MTNATTKHERAEAKRLARLAKLAATQVLEATKAQEETAPALTPENKGTKSVIAHRYRVKYRAAGDAKCCGDSFAAKMRGLNHHEVLALGAANGIDAATRWGGKNNGMVRMNLGNVLRGMANRDEEIVW